jgi:hypothetical protein
MRATDDHRRLRRLELVEALPPGFFNSGDGNIGMFSSGSKVFMPGHLNSLGFGNSGIGNIGLGDSGNVNTGFWNSGNVNTGSGPPPTAD